MNQKTKDQQLVQNSINNPEQFQEIILLYESKLRSYVSKIGSYSSSEIDDILQNTFLKAWKNLQSYNPKYALSTWIYRIARNEALSFFRRWSSTWKNVSLDENIYTFKSDEDFVKELDGKIDSEKIKTVLHSLKDKYREVLILYYFQELSYQEISDILRKPTNSVGTLVSRAKKQFKTQWHKITPHNE